MRPLIHRLGDAWANSRLRRDERGMALALAIAVMLVLTILLTSVIFLTSSSARDAHRNNATQKAYALAQAGIHNALAVLNSNYPTSTYVFPGNPTLLSDAGCPCTSSYSTGSVTWTGTLNPAPASASWRYEWDLSATGSVRNPTGPTGSPLKSTATAVVPIVVPDTSSVDPTKSVLNWVYGHNVSFGQSVVVKSPVFATGDLILTGTATIGELVPASAGSGGTPAHPNVVNVVGTVQQNNVGSNQNHIGHVETTTDPAGQLLNVYVGTGQCKISNGSLHTCTYNSTASGADWIFTKGFAQTTVDPPSFTCCAPITAGAPMTTLQTAHPAIAPDPSDLGFWYTNANLGPKTPCGYYTQVGTITPPLRFDNPAVAPTAVGADNTIDQSSTAGGPAFDITPAGAKYDCRSIDGQYQLSWNGTNSNWSFVPTGAPAGTPSVTVPANTLLINGSVYLDGSATSSADPATYLGLGALILSGTFQMTNHEELCVAVTGKNCDTTAPWDPNKAGMFIFAGGDFTTDRSTQQTNANGSGVSIEMKQAQFQGGLFAPGIIDASVTGTVVDGPMISAYTDVFAGQSGILTFPPIAFPSSGTDGFTGPFPIARLLTPRQFGGG